MAENMHQLLFWCPKCGGELTMESCGDSIRCKKCGNGGHLNEYYDLIPDAGSELPERPRASGSTCSASVRAPWYAARASNTRSTYR